MSSHIVRIWSIDFSIGAAFNRLGYSSGSRAVPSTVDPLRQVISHSFHHIVKFFNEKSGDEYQKNCLLRVLHAIYVLGKKARISGFFNARRRKLFTFAICHKPLNFSDIIRHELVKTVYESCGDSQQTLLSPT
jgi:hypothetical protein